MKENIKYTTDGRKVVIIGDLNQTEKIVQEIFVTEDGAEIPSGERFVVKSLLDTPAKSWKEKNISDLEARYDRVKEHWEKRIKDINKEKELVYKSLSLRVKWLKQVAKQPHPESLKKVIETLTMFLSNTDMWVFYADYSKWHLEKYDQEGFSRIHDYVDYDYSTPKLEYMKLVSLFGKTNGDFEFRINKYYDGSGSYNKVEYFKSKEDALIYMQNRFDNIDAYKEHHLDIAKKFDLKVNDSKLAAFKDIKRQSILKNIENKSKELSDYQEQLNQLTQ